MSTDQAKGAIPWPETRRSGAGRRPPAPPLRVTLDLASPTGVYQAVGAALDKILAVLDVDTAVEEIAQAQLQSRDLLAALKVELDERLQKLRAHEEWDIFTIACYGETNAGKSTLIETLRILLGERGKGERRKNFDALSMEFGLSPAALEAGSLELAQSEEAAQALAARVAREKADLEQRAKLLAEQRRTLEADWDAYRDAAPFWRRWLFSLRKPAREIAKDEAARACEIFEAQKQAHLAAAHQEERAAADRVEKAARRRTQQEAAFAQLTQYADGEIIGDGRSDYTRDAISYSFDVDGRRFDLIDVPGIEGDEKQVSDQIWNAVHTAHAVFYVTSKAARQQKGEPGQPGTLEKIQRHLSDQTQVWGIFNKRITNPVYLDRPELVSADEAASLAVLDQKMTEQLQACYQGHLALSAQPAFLAVADRLVPHSAEDKSRSKFLKNLSPTQLLDRTGLSAFQRLLTGSFIDDYRRKIRVANFNKAVKLVDQAIAHLKAVQTNNFGPLRAVLHEEGQAARQQMALLVPALRKSLEAHVSREITAFKVRVSKKVNARIANNISHDEFKQALTEEVKAGQNELAISMTERFAHAVESFGREVQDVAARFQEFANEHIAQYGHVDVEGLNGPMTLRFKLDNGIKIGALLSSVVSAAAYAMNPGTWPFAVLAIASLLVAVGKALWAYFDDDYKKREQSRSLNDNLQKVANQLRDSASKSVEDHLTQIGAEMQGVIDGLSQPVEQLDRLMSVLRRSTRQLVELSTDISRHGAKA